MQTQQTMGGKTHIAETKSPHQINNDKIFSEKN